MLAAQPVTRHVHFGDLHHSPHQAPTLYSAQAFGYFGGPVGSQGVYAFGSSIPQFTDMIQELPVEQSVYPDMAMYDDGDASQEEAGDMQSTTEPTASSLQFAERRTINSNDAYRMVAENEVTQAAMLQAKGNWNHTEPVRYQSTMDFKEDMLRNRHISVNEQTFADWVWPPSEQNPQKMYQQDCVRWGTDARFDSLGNPTSKFGEGRVGVRQLTQFRLKVMPEEEEEDEEAEDSGNASPSPSASSVSQAESSKPRTRLRHTARDAAAPKKSYARPAAGSTSERPTAQSDVKRQREKLTIEQKRRNHIRHEKKRRALIKDGFNDLTELIPELRGRTLSRSTILFKAADWLENLIQENEALVAQVSALESEKAANLAGTAEAPPHQGSQKRSRRKA